MKQSKFNSLKTKRSFENPFEKGDPFTNYNTPSVIRLKQQYHTIIADHLRNENFEYNVVADLGCGLPFATLPFAQKQDKSLICLDGYRTNRKQYLFTQHQLINFFKMQSGDVAFHNLDAPFQMPKADVWISIMAVGKMIDPKVHYRTIKDNSNEDAKIFFVVYKDNWYDSISIENIIADSFNCNDIRLASNNSKELVLAEVKFTDNHLSV